MAMAGLPIGTPVEVPAEPPAEPEYYHGFYLNQHYGHVKRDYSAIVKCTEKQADALVEEMNYNNGRQFNGTPLGMIGSQNYYACERIFRIYHTYDDFRDMINKRKQAVRESRICEEAWRYF